MFAESLGIMVFAIGTGVFLWGLSSIAARALQIYTSHELPSIFYGVVGSYGYGSYGSWVFSSAGTWVVGTTIYYVMAYIPIALTSWLILGFEHRGFLRTRELLADAQSVRWNGEIAFATALRHKARVRRVDKLGIFYRPFDAHPLLQNRIALIINPESVGLPGRMWHASLGYISGMLITFLSTIIELSELTFPELKTQLEAPTYIAYLHEVFYSGSLAGVIYALCSNVVTGSLLFVLLSAILRQAINANLNKTYCKSVPEWIFKGGVLSLGIVVGSFFSPLAFGFREGWSIFPPGLTFISAFQIVYFILGGSLIYPVFIVMTLPLAGWILGGNRRKPISTAAWVMIFIFYVCTLAQIFGLILVSINPEYLGFGDINGSTKTFSKMVVGLVIWGTLTFAASLLLRGSLKSNKMFSPWLYL